MKKLPYGISNYEELIEGNYYYVDKTKYIEKIEDLAERYIMMLRPRKFGKTLFTSTLEYYYDINGKEKFEELFKDTYIGKNPTDSRNTYHVLRFDFSGIDTSTEENAINGFKDKVQIAIQGFVQYYKLDFFVNLEETAETMLNSLFCSFRIQKPGEKIYVIIDEYDRFANELLEFNTNKFEELISINRKVRVWYEILKKGTESVVSRIFMTGVAPISLDSLTSGFNIGSDKTKNRSFNEMLGFTQDEVKQIMDELEIDDKTQKELMPILKENYGGYRFSIDAEEKMHNPNMCLYFLKEYKNSGKMPRNLIDVNIASDYSKLSSVLELYKGEGRLEILKSTTSGEGIKTSIIERFNPEVEFREKEFVSMLFYLGYLTITGEWLGRAKLNIPNLIMKEL